MKTESLLEAKRSLQIEGDAVAGVARWLDMDAVGRAVDCMATAQRIVTSACGSSGAAAMKLAHSLCCIERPAKFMPPSEAVHGGLGCLQKGDVLVLVSRGGKTAELLPILQVANKKGAVVVALTENLDSPMARDADVVIPLQIPRESDKYNAMATSSFLITITVFDAILAALIEETGYRLEQFALIHPGGAVGERLNP